jgi:microcystin-dependent protein
MDPFLGEIRMFAGTFAPRGWAFCDGQLLAVSQNDALFSLFGTIYGGDGRTTFALPDLRGRVPVHPGTGPGLTNRRIGERGGSEQTTLASSQLAAHTHAMNASTSAASNAVGPEGSVSGATDPALLYGDPGAGLVAMDASAVSDAGGGQPHDNMAPALAIRFIVALVGIYPSRS